MNAPRIVPIVLLATFLVGCSGLTEGKASSEKAIAHFHELYNHGNLDQIWKDATPAFRDSSPRAKYDELFGAFQRKLGNVVSTSNTGWNVQSFNLSTTVSMTQDTMFEHGQGTESFTFTMDGANALLVGYNIQSTDLITK